MPTYSLLLKYTQALDNHEHTQVSNNYKEENGVRASEGEIPCSLSIKPPFLCLSSVLFEILSNIQTELPNSKSTFFHFFSWFPCFVSLLFTQLLIVLGYTLPLFFFLPIYVRLHLCHCLVITSQIKEYLKMTAIKLSFRFFSCFHISVSFHSRRQGDFSLLLLSGLVMSEVFLLAFKSCARSFPPVEIELYHYAGSRSIVILWNETVKTLSF